MSFLFRSQGSRKPAQPGRSSRCRPVLEQLEDRWVPAQFTNFDRQERHAKFGLLLTGPAPPQRSVCTVDQVAAAILRQIISEIEEQSWGVFLS